jgi:hypothetical protein
MATPDQRSQVQTTRQRRRTPWPKPPGARATDAVDEVDIVKLVQQARHQADDARKPRLAQNRRNQEAFLGRQDWSDKQPGQSREFLPKTPIAAEQIANYIKRSLTDYGDWFQVELPQESPLSPDDARAWLQQELELMHRVQPGRIDFPTLIADAVKMALLQSLAIVKIHGRDLARREWAVEKGQTLVDVPMPPSPMIPAGTTVQMPQEQVTLIQRVSARWSLVVDLISPEDYYPDPTGQGLYEIHRVERDLSEVRAMAEAGVYDPAAVAELEASAAKAWDSYQRAALAGQADAPDLPWRPRVRLDEYWGTITSPTGRILYENIVTTVANESVLVRPPTPNPFWHNQSPFVAAPLMRVPLSIWHKALFDNAVALNIGMNELFSLMLDGGLASVWGTRQIRPGMLEDPRQISSGIPQGATLVVKDEVPPGVKVMELCTQGGIPPDAFNMFQFVNGEFQEATLISDIQKGRTPPKQTTATAIVQATQSSQSFFDGLVRDLEDKLIEPTLWKAWATLLQHADDVRASDVATAMGPASAMRLAQLSPAERFASMAAGARFRVRGVSATTARGQDFQKLMALMQAVAGNPMLLQAFMASYSADKVLTQLLRSLNVDPRTIELTPEERQQQAMRTMMAQQQVGGLGAEAPGGGAPSPAQLLGAGGPPMPAEPVPPVTGP